MPKKLSSIEVVNSFIENKGIKDEDLQQELYLIAIEHGKEYTYHKLYSSLISRVNEYEKEKENINSVEYKCLEELDMLSEEYVDKYIVLKELECIVLKTLLSEKILKEREAVVLLMRFYKNMSLDACGKELNITGQAVRQIEAKALRKLRYPIVNKNLRGYFDLF